MIFKLVHKIKKKDYEKDKPHFNFQFNFLLLKKNLSMKVKYLIYQENLSVVKICQGIGWLTCMHPLLVP